MSSAVSLSRTKLVNNNGDRLAGDLIGDDGGSSGVIGGAGVAGSGFGYQPKPGGEGTHYLIEDFSDKAGDRIDLSLIREHAGLERFIWGGDKPTAYGVWVEHQGGVTRVYADTSGKPEAAKPLLTITGTHALDKADFGGVDYGLATAQDDDNARDALTEAGTGKAGDAQAAGNVLTNDDAEGAMDVTGVAFGENEGAVGTALKGQYGTLTLNSDGSYVYVLDNSLAATQGLAAGQTAQEIFHYTVNNGQGAHSTATLTLSIAGADDAAEIRGAVPGALTESDEAMSTGGKLELSDADGGSARFIARTNVNGSSAYGKFSIAADGTWTYKAGAHDEFAEGRTYTDSFTVRTTDGGERVITVTMIGTNDAATFKGVDTAHLTEGDGALSAKGRLLNVDVDSSTAVIAQTQTQGAYGSFSIDVRGNWRYEAGSHNEFEGGRTYTDTFVVIAADGTPHKVTVSLVGTNDAAVITGTSTAELTESDAPLSAGGKLDVADVDSAETFVAGTWEGAYGSLTLSADGTWSYQAGAHDELSEGSVVSESFVVKTADGTPQTISITIRGTNDAAVLSSESQTLQETDGPVGTSGALTISDVDSPQSFQPGSNIAGEHGVFSITAAGTWTYLANEAFDRLNVGDSVSDRFVVKAADGTETSVTVTLTGTNDAAVLSSAAIELSETDAPLTTGGTLTISDVDNANRFRAQQDVAGRYGVFSVDASGEWHYQANEAFDTLNVGDRLSERFVVVAVDGTETTVSITIKGTNDAAVIAGSSRAALTESDDVLRAEGQLSVSDVDSDATFVQQIGAPGKQGYGHFDIGADGHWTYTTDTAHNEFSPGKTYTDEITVATADGTTQIIRVTLTGTNDAPVVKASETLRVTEDTVAPVVDGLGTASDVDAGTVLKVVGLPDALPPGVQFNAETQGFTLDAGHQAYQSLAEGETATVSVAYQVSDGIASTDAMVRWTVVGTNDAALITGTRTVTLTETDSALSAEGKLDATDVDSSAAFVELIGERGDNGYGRFDLDADGRWTYIADTAHNEFEAGRTYIDTITVRTADGTTQVLTIRFEGTNDAAQITAMASGTAKMSSAATTDGTAGFNHALTEGDEVLSTGGTLLAEDVDSATDFIPQSEVLGDGGYGRFTLNADGTWTYRTIGAHDEFVEGKTYVDRLTVSTEDGTQQVITVTLTGTNDGAQMGAPTVSAVTEDVAVADGQLTASGQIAIADKDAGEDYLRTEVVSADGNLGTLTLSADGHYTYAVDNAAVQYLGSADAPSKTETFTVTAADGTTRTVSFTITGAQDGAVIGTPTVSALTEDEQDGSLVAKGSISISDADQGEAHFRQEVAAADGNLGTLVLAEDGSYAYAIADADVQYLGDGESRVERFTVTSADGTSKELSFTIHGVNDAAVIGAPTLSVLTEDSDQPTLAAEGRISISDADRGQAVFRTVVAAAEGNLGNLVLAEDGAYRYSVANEAVQFLGEGQNKVDSFTVTAADGTTRVVSFTIEGVNDAARIGTPTVIDLTEDTDAPALIARGSISIADADEGQAHFRTAVTSAEGNLGQLVLAADGSYTYSVANADVQYLGEGETRIEHFTVTAADGSTQGVSFTIHGTNDAAVIGAPTVADVTEDSDASMLRAQGRIAIGDADQDQAFLRTTVMPEGDNLGTLALDADGAYSYSVSNAQVQYLGEGETRVESFRVESADGTSRTVSFTITGTNDVAQIGAPTATVAGEDDGGEGGSIAIRGSLTISDADQGQAVFRTEVEPQKGNLGTLVLGEDGSYAYSVAAQDVQYLNEGEVRTERFTVRAADGTSREIAFQITGTNDAAVITGSATDELVETNVVLSAGGQLSISDVDNPSAFVPVADVPGDSGLGRFSLDATGHWSYTATSAHDAFAAGQTFSDRIVVKAVDGTQHELTVNWIGTNDGPVVRGAESRALGEDEAASVVDALAGASDADDGAVLSVVPPASLPEGVSYDAGTHSFKLDPAAFQALGENESVTVTVSYGVSDGTVTTPASLSWVVQGTNDVPTVTPVTLAAIDEDSGARLITQAELLGTARDADDQNLQAIDLVIDGGKGTLADNGDGTWLYTPAANDDTEVSFRFTVTDPDGATAPGQATLDLRPVDDLSRISGTSAQTLQETNAVLSTSGKLVAEDIDGPQATVAFKPLSEVSGSAGLGRFSIDAQGQWSYVTTGALDNLAQGQTVIDSITVEAADGTRQTISVTLRGTDDAAVITGKSQASLTETDAVLTTSGKLNVTDADGPAAFAPLDNVAGSNGHGRFSIASDGTWTYRADTAHNEFKADEIYTDSISVQVTDGSTQLVTVSIRGTNDAATISGTRTVSLTETNAILTTGGKLTVEDVDSAASFVARTDVAGSKGYGLFSIGADGNWSYRTTTAHDEFAPGQTYSETFTVASADGTTSVITVNIAGTSDVPVIAGATTASLTETDAILSATGKLTISDAGLSFRTQSNVAGTNGYGKFAVGSDGTWTYTTNSAQNQFVAGQTYTDSFTVQATDGTSQVVTVSIAGTNDVPTLRSLSGALDLVIGNSGGSLVGLNSGSNTFTQSASLSTNTSVSYAMAMADMNNDGKLDIVDVGNYVSAGGVALGNGDGTFKAVQSYQLSLSERYGLAIGDLNADGKLDVVTTNWSSSTSVLLGNGDGTLKAPVIVNSNLGGGQTGVALGDVNNDGKLDIVSSSWGGQASVNLGRGDGTFQGAVVAPVGVGYHYSVALGDVNGDGKLDMAVTNDYSSNGVTLSLGNGDGTFRSGVSLATGVTSGHWGVSLADVNNDGRMDVVVANDGSNGASVLLGNGNGTFQAATQVATGGSSHWGLQVADVTGDGNADIVVADSSVGAYLSVGNGSGGFAAGTAINLGGNNHYALAVGDVNGDGRTATLTEGAAQNTATGRLAITDADTGQSSFAAQTSVSGTYGTFSLTSGGQWTYTLDNARAATQALAAGQTVNETFKAWSADGTASIDVSIPIKGITNVITGTSSSDTLTGGAGVDQIDGGSGADRINGGAGADFLTGGNGADTFVFSHLNAGKDTISDFKSGTDKIELALDVFTALTGQGTVSADEFLASNGGQATTADQHVLFDKLTGTLYYDPDGNGDQQRVEIAALTGVTDLKNTDVGKG